MDALLCLHFNLTAFFLLCRQQTFQAVTAKVTQVLKARAALAQTVRGRFFVTYSKRRL